MPPSVRRRLRIGVVGVGRIGRRHARLVAASPSAELVAIADPAPDATKFSIALDVPAYRTPEEMLAVERLDGMILATPNAHHRDGALVGLGAGIATLVEKPIATSVAEGLEMALAADRTGVPLLVGHHRRHSPLIVAAREAVASGVLGDVVAVLGTALFPKPGDYFESAPWRASPGGGPILINLVHEIDSLRVLCGEIVSVQAVASNRVRRHPVEDTVAVTMRFASGALGAFLLSDAAASGLSWEQTSGEDPAYAQYPGQDTYVVTGTRGSLGIPTLRLSLVENAPSWHEPMQTRRLVASDADPLARQLEHFCEVIRGCAQPLVPALDAVQTLRVTQAVAEAAESGETVWCGPGEPAGTLLDRPPGGS